MEGVIKITHYECLICGNRYDKETDAKKCYDKGLYTKYPIGCIYGDHRKGVFYENITFAIAENRACETNKHLNNGSSWACRDTGCGDSLGKSMCGGNFLNLNEYHSHIDIEAPHFKRMVEWLREQGINITVWNGIEAIPLLKYIRLKKGIKSI